MMRAAKPVACFFAVSLAGTCHDNRHDVSARVRSGRSIQVKASPDLLLKTLEDAETLEAVAAFMAQHADSWSGEEIFGTLPASGLLLEVRNEKGELLQGIGIGDESLWLYPSLGVWRHLDRQERDDLLRILRISAESAYGLK